MLYIMLGKSLQEQRCRWLDRCVVFSWRTSEEWRKLTLNVEKRKGMIFPKRRKNWTYKVVHEYYVICWYRLSATVFSSKSSIVWTLSCNESVNMVTHKLSKISGVIKVSYKTLEVCFLYINTHKFIQISVYSSFNLWIIGLRNKYKTNWNIAENNIKDDHKQ